MIVGLVGVGGLGYVFLVFIDLLFEGSFFEFVVSIVFFLLFFCIVFVVFLLGKLCIRRGVCNRRFVFFI